MRKLASLGTAVFLATLATCALAQNDPGRVTPADQDFMKKAAQGNIAEIETGKLAQDKGVSEGIKQFGEKMQEEHGKVLEELQALAKSKGVTLPQAPDEKHKAMAKKLAAESGKQFDRAYASVAGVADHQAAKQLFEQGARSKDPEVSAFARKVLPDIEHHLEMARDLAGKS